MKVHYLKTNAEYFEAVFSGVKTFELRLNDRNFEVNDHLILLEYFPETSSNSGRFCSFRISYILDLQIFFPDLRNWVILSIVKI